MKDNSRNTYLIIGGVLVLAGCYFTISQLTSKEKNDSGVTFKDVDRLRKDVEHQKKLQQDKAMVDNFKSAPLLPTKYRPTQSGNFQDKSLQLQSSVNHAAIDGGDSGGITARSLDNQINDLLLAKQRYEQLSKVERQKYVNDFKREAQAMGYQVEFNEKLEVIRFDRAPSSQAKALVKTLPPPPPPTSGVDSQENYDDAE